MRDPKRIDVIVELLRAYWHANPDARLGQMVSNLTPNRFQRTDGDGFTFRDPFYVEDTEMEHSLREELRRIAKEHK